MGRLLFRHDDARTGNFSFFLLSFLSLSTPPVLYPLLFFLPALFPCLSPSFDSFSFFPKYFTSEPFISWDFDIRIQKIGNHFRAFRRTSKHWKSNVDIAMKDEDIEVEDRYKVQEKKEKVEGEGKGEGGGHDYEQGVELQNFGIRGCW
jgi:hypothetical protein